MASLIRYELQARAHRAYNRRLLGGVSMHGMPLLEGLDDNTIEWLASAVVRANCHRVPPSAPLIASDDVAHQSVPPSATECPCDCV